MRICKCQQCKGEFAEDDSNPAIHYSEPAKICSRCEKSNKLSKDKMKYEDQVDRSFRKDERYVTTTVRELIEELKQLPGDMPLDEPLRVSVAKHLRGGEDGEDILKVSIEEEW